MRTVFITGAGGYVGSRLLTFLREKGFEVVAGVRNRARKLAYERQNEKALVCEITDPINVARAIASVRPDGVVHLGGPSRPADATAEPLEAYQGIVTAWANVLDAVRRTVPRAKIVLASACDVYGNAGPDGRALSECTPLQPISTFGSLKATAEGIARTYHREYHLDVTIARPFHYTGPGQPAKFFFGSVARALTSWGTTPERELRLPDLSCRRDVLHVDDVVAAYARLLEDGRPNEAYNICSGETVTCREVVEMMVAALGYELRLVEEPSAPPNGQATTLRGDGGRLRTELNWAPARTVRDAARELVASYREARAPVTA